MKRIMAILVILCVLTGLCSCALNTDVDISKISAKTISDLSYEANKHKIPVYIEENHGNKTEYVPYYAVTNNYDGDVLLLRASVLPEKRKISEYFSDYYYSKVDRYLNGDFLNCLGDFADRIITKTIEIKPLAYEPDDIDRMERKVFLLSATEVGIVAAGLPKEGHKLDFFSNKENVICYDNPETSTNPQPYWLRTPCYAANSLTFCIGNDGSLGSANASDLCGVRPAFCVDKDEPIKITDIDGKQAFVFI